VAVPSHVSQPPLWRTFRAAGSAAAHALGGVQIAHATTQLYARAGINLQEALQKAASGMA